MNSGTLNLDMTNRIRWPRVTIRSPYNKRKQLSPVAKRVQMLKLILIRDCFSYNIQQRITKELTYKASGVEQFSPMGTFPSENLLYISLFPGEKLTSCIQQFFPNSKVFGSDFIRINMESQQGIKSTKCLYTPRLHSSIYICIPL